MRKIAALFATFTLLLSGASWAGEEQSAHDFSFNGLNGKPLEMAAFKGKTVLLVNTASKCGYTPQYKGLQALWKDYEDKGLVVIGVPSGDFRDQEYDDNEKIAQFCEINYGVTFPLAEKNHVVGDEAHAIYKWLKASLGEESAPQWNFHKYLISADGTPVTWFATKVKPQDDVVIAAIEAQIGG